MLDVPVPRFSRAFFRTAILAGVSISALGSPVRADCIAIGNTTTCNTAAPNPYTTRVGAGNTLAGDNQTVTVEAGGSISSGNDTAISLRDNANIMVDGTVQNSSTNASGGYNTGGNTIEFRNNGTLTIGSGGQVLSNGTQVSAEAINVQGSGNTINNNGLVNAVRGAAIWSQRAGTLTVVNNGTISTGPLANPNRTATVIGGNTNAGIDFTNRGTVFGSLNLGSGPDTLRLYTGSNITGNFSGGGGVDSIYLNGTGSDSLSGTMTGFEYLYKQDAGTWELSGSITGLIAANVQAGTLILSGDNSGFTGTTTVDSGATLQGRAQSLPGAITNSGLVRFDQPDNGTYSGVISGSGGLEKTGIGVVTLTSALAYSGPTTVSVGTLILEGNNSGYAGATTVGSGATLQGNALSLPNDIANSGLVRFDQPNAGTYSGVISGVGGLDKAGAGTLTLANSQTYTGATTVSDGTLVLLGNLVSSTSVASGATLRGVGTIFGTVTNEGTIAPGTQGEIGTLTIQGNYIGNGGILQTRVGGTPQAPVADVLQIAGAGNTASGNTGITAIDAGGLGAPTTGDGILVVQALNGATTGTTAFALADRVASGAYEYHLVRGASAGKQQNWYLTTYVDPPVPPGPEPGPTPPSPDPDFRVETSTYPALPALQRLYTYSIVDTLEQRRGSLGTLAALGLEENSGLWGRAGGSFGETYGSGADGIDMSYDFGFLQAGVDAVSTSDGHGGRVDAGVFLGIGTSTTDTSTAADGNTGDATFNAYSVGLYGTWLATSGFYADTLLQATRFSDAAAHSSGNASITTDGWSQSLSLEAGYRVGLGDSASLTPQGQIIAENFTLDGTSDEFGDVSFDNGFAARGRLGLELASNVDGFGTRTDLTLRANVWHVFADNPQTTFSSLEGSDQVSFDANFGTTWLALDAGITTAVTDNASLFANAGYEYGFDDSRQAGTGRLGFAYNW